MSFEPLKEQCYFRYRNISEYTIEEIVKGQIWHSRIEHLNDPFEHAFYYDENDFTIDQLDSFFELMLKGNEAYLADMRKKGLEESVYKQFKYWLQTHIPKILEMHNTACVACFSGNPTDGLMWSHYADKLKGICIAYNKSKLKNQKFFSEIKPIRYMEEVTKVTFKDIKLRAYNKDNGPIPTHGIVWPIVLPLTNTTGTVINLYVNTHNFDHGFQKHERWSYECESRNVLFPEKEEQDQIGLFANTGSDTIDAIIIGEKASDGDLSRIMDITEDRNIPLYIARANKRNYQVEIELYK